MLGELAMGDLGVSRELLHVAWLLLVLGRLRRVVLLRRSTISWLAAIALALKVSAGCSSVAGGAGSWIPRAGTVILVPGILLGIS